MSAQALERLEGIAARLRADRPRILPRSLLVSLVQNAALSRARRRDVPVYPLCHGPRRPFAKRPARSRADRQKEFHTTYCSAPPPFRLRTPSASSCCTTARTCCWALSTSLI